MNQKLLKRLRWVVSLFILAAFAGLFIDFTETFPSWLGDGILFFQFIPSLLKFTSWLGIGTIGFIVIIILTSLFGRVYCSFLCPLGVLQDVIIRLRHLRKPVHKKVGSYNVLRYNILAVSAFLLCINITSLISYLDPYSNFGRVCFHLFRPFVVIGNNLVSSALEKASIYAVSPVAMKHISIPSVIFSSLFLILLIVLVVKRGRLFCNTLCPVGALLGLISKKSIFKIQIAESTCTRCGKCEKVCKSGCIDSKNKELDFSRCVSCYNCLSVCKFNSLSLSKKQNPKTEDTVVEPNSRRVFLKSGAMFLLAFSLVGKAAHAIGDSLKPIIPIKRKRSVTPPGSHSLTHFKEKCTSCHLCVSQCPSQVLQPSTTEYGWDGFMKPVMNFKSGFCNYNCTNCGHVCPTGAIQPLDKKDKKLTQLGVAIFVEENCIVYRKDKDCGACSEHCPTKAVRMVPYGDVYIPKVDAELCIGCGACEHVCPAKPYLAIYIEGNDQHKKAVPPESKPAALLDVRKKHKKEDGKTDKQHPDKEMKETKKDSSTKKATKSTDDFPF